MKIKVLASVLLFSASLCAHAQSTLVIYTDDGARFTLTVDGKQENNTPKDQVRVSGLGGDKHAARIVFEEQGTTPITCDVHLLDPLGEPAEVTYHAFPIGGGTYGIKKLACVPAIGGSSAANDDNTQPAPANGQFYDYTAPVNVQQTTTVARTNNNQPAIATAVQNNAQPEQGSANTLTHMPAANNTTNTAAVQQTTTQYSLQPSDNPPAAHRGRREKVRSHARDIECTDAMENDDFQQIRTLMFKTDDENDRMSVAKTAIDGHCLNTQQVYELSRLLVYEKSRLTYAEYAFKRTIDPDNYDKVKQLLDQEADRQELSLWINTH